MIKPAARLQDRPAIRYFHELSEEDQKVAIAEAFADFMHPGAWDFDIGFSEQGGVERDDESAAEVEAERALLREFAEAHCPKLWGKVLELARMARCYVEEAPGIAHAVPLLMSDESVAGAGTRKGAA